MSLHGTWISNESHKNFVSSNDNDFLNILIMTHRRSRLDTRHSKRERAFQVHSLLTEEYPNMMEKYYLFYLLKLFSSLHYFLDYLSPFNNFRDSVFYGALFPAA